MIVCEMSESDPDQPNARLLVESVRLLLFVAWSDDDIAPEEYDFLLRKVRNAGFDADAIDSLDRALRDKSTLVQPDMEFLKPHHQTVLAEVRELVHADDRVAPEEITIMDKITKMLTS